MYDEYKDFDIDTLYVAVQDIAALYEKTEAHYMALRLTEPEVVHDVIKGTKSITVDRITDLSEYITESAIIFVALGGDKGKSEVDWETGFFAIARVTKTPYDIGYERNKRETDYFKFDMRIEITLPEPIPRSGFMNYPATYDAPYIGLEIHRDRSQANSALEDDKAVAIIRAVIDKFPDLKDSISSIFPEEFMNRVLGAATVLLPVSVNYGEDAKEEVEKTPSEDIDDEADTVPIDTYTVDDFVNEVFMDSEEYYAISALLLRKKNIILQGAPGVGKTFMAKRLAYSHNFPYITNVWEVV